MNKVYGEMMNEKVFTTIKGEISINETPITREDFDALLQEERAKSEAAQAAAQEKEIVNTEAEVEKPEEV